MSPSPAPAASARPLRDRLPVIVGIGGAALCGAMLGELVWRAQVDANRGAPPPGWREAVSAPALTSRTDWGPLRSRHDDFAPAGGVVWRPQSAGHGRGAAVSARLDVPAEGWAELWLGAPGATDAVGLRLDRLDETASWSLRGAPADCQPKAAALPRGPIHAELTYANSDLRWSVGAAQGTCRMPAPAAGAALRTGARTVGVHELVVDEAPVRPPPRPYRGGAWLIGAGIAACFVLAQLGVGSPLWVAALTIVPLGLALPLVLVDPGPAHGLPLNVADPGPLGLAAAPALFAALAAVLLQAGRAMRDPRPGRDWPWAAPAAAAMPSALLNAWVNPPTSPVISALIGAAGGLFLIAFLVGALAIAGHVRPRRAAALALVPAIAFGGALALGARTLPVVGGAAAFGLLLGLAAAELSRKGPRAWSAAVAALGAVLVLDLSLRATSIPPVLVAPPEPTAPPGTGGGRDLVAAVWGERPGHGPGTIADALGPGWEIAYGPPRSASAAPAIAVIIVGEQLLSERHGEPEGIWGAALELRRSWQAARARALAPAVLPRAAAIQARATARGLPVLLVLDPKQADPSALASLRAGLRAAVAADAQPAVRLVDPALTAWQTDRPLLHNAGWLRTPEGGQWYSALIRASVAPLIPPAADPPKPTSPP